MNGQLQTRALDELLHRGRYLYPTDVVEIVERFHAVEGPGVPREVVRAYAGEVLRRLGQRAPYTLRRFDRLLEDRLTDVDVWLPNALFAVAPGRVSVYPARWHRELTGVRDPVTYVSAIGADLAAARGGDPSAGLPPVPRTTLVDAMMTLGDLDRPTAAGLLREARLADRLRVEPDQNPDADVWLATPTQPAPATPTAEQVGAKPAPEPTGSSAPPRA